MLKGSDDGALLELALCGDAPAPLNLGFVNSYDADLRPDITDANARFVFEIKPPGAEHLAEGKSKIDE